MHSRSRVNVSETHVPLQTHFNKTNEIPPFASDRHAVVEIVPEASPNNSHGNEEMLRACEGIYSPILKTMKFFGVYFGETSLKRMSSVFFLGRRRVSISLLYCCATMATVWFNVAMALISLCMEGTTVLSTFFVLLLCFLWSLVTALSGTICMFVLPLTEAKQSRFENFIRSLIDCNAEFGKLRTALHKILIVAVAVWITITVSAVISLLYMPWTSVGRYKPWDIWYGFRIVSLISLILGYGSWLLPVSFFCTTCLVLEQLFVDFCERTSTKILNSLDLTALKDKHCKLRGAVKLASKMFSPLLLVLFSLYIPLLCFTFYIAVNRPQSQISLFFCIFWIILTSGNVAVFLVLGTRVNEKIHSFQNILEAAKVSDEDQMKLLAFMFYLNGEPKGLSIGGLAVITKSLSLTIVGIIVSYFAVMLSFPS